MLIHCKQVDGYKYIEGWIELIDHLTTVVLKKYLQQSSNLLNKKYVQVKIAK